LVRLELVEFNAEETILLQGYTFVV